jgi:hypothetical protein
MAVVSEGSSYASRRPTGVSAVGTVLDRLCDRRRLDIRTCLLWNAVQGAPRPSTFAMAAALVYLWVGVGREPMTHVHIWFAILLSSSVS